MNLENYEALCRVSDNLLTDPKAGAFRVSIPWLHIVREHPHFLGQYEYLFQDNRPLIVVRANLICRIARYIASWAGYVIFGLQPVRREINNLHRLPQSADLLIVSHLVNPKHLDSTKDFYFDELPFYLEKNGFRVVVALVNHTNNQFDDNCVSSDDRGVRLVLSRSMGLKKALACFCGAMKERALLKRSARAATTPLTRSIAERAAIEALSGGARDAQRIGIQISELVERLHVRAVLTTYEGHAWERTVFGLVRRNSPSVKCMAYQHALIFKFQHGITRSLGKKFDPDVVFTSGEAARERLVRQAERTSQHVVVMGSARALTGNKVQADGDAYKRRDESVCLVLPEGIISEAIALLNYAVRCASELPTMKFVFHLHPAIEPSSLSAYIPDLSTLPAKNIIWSSRPLDDYARYASWVLYRGTTAVVAGLQYGALPVYLKIENELNIDPLHSLGDERFEVRTVADFLRCVSDNGSDDQFRTAHRKKIAECCDRLFSPLNFRVVCDYLNIAS